MPRRLIVLALAAAGSLALVAWFALDLGSRGSRSDVAAAAQGEPASAARSGSEPASLAAPAAAARPAVEAAQAPSAPAELASEPSEQRTAVKRSSAYEEELARGHWVEGRLVFPPGTPADEQAVVRASGFDFEHGPDHSVEVAPDGSFRVAFSEKTRKGRLYVEARYLYLEESVGVDLRADVAPVTLEPRLGGRIEGKLLLPADGSLAAESLGGASLSLAPTGSGDESWSDDRSCEAEGLAFAFAGIAPDKGYDVDLDSELAYCRTAEGVRVEAGRTASIALEVRAGVTVEGRVVDESGAPLSGVGVQARSNDQSSGIFSYRVVESGDDGAFRAQGLVPGPITLEVRAPGFASLERELSTTHDGELASIELVLERGGQISGRVRWPDGTPAVGATVETLAEERPASRSMFFPSPQSAESDEDGCFAVSGLDAGSCRVVARATRTEEVQETSPITGKQRTRKLRSRWTATLEHVASGTSGLELVLDPGLTLTGLVQDDLGRPLDRFSVTAEPAREGAAFLGHDDSLQRSFDHAAGRFELSGLASGRWTVHAEADGSTSEEHELALPDEPGPIELVVPRPARIEGTVVDPSGRGVGEATVSWSTDLETRSWDFSGDDRTVSVDPSGRFVLEQVRPGALSLVAESALAAPSAPVQVEVEPGGRASDVLLRLRPGGRITALVVDASGNGLAGRQVLLWGDEGGLNEDGQTGEDGAFVFERLPAGGYRLSSPPSPAEVAEVSGKELGARQSGFLQRDATVELAEEEDARVVLAPPEVHPVELHGRVTAGDAPLARANVWSTNEGGNWSSTETDGEGAYSMLLAGPGPRSFGVFDARTGLRTSAQLDVPDVRSYVFDVAIAVGTISGRVFAPDGKPLAIAVNAQSEEDGETGGQVQSDPEGRYEIRVPAGTYTVTAGDLNWWDGPASGLAPARVQGVAVATGAHVRGVDLRVERGGSIAARVRMADGSLPKGRVWVMVVDEDGEPITGRPTDGLGQCLLEGVPPGTAQVNAGSEHEVLQKQVTVDVRSGETSAVELVLVSGTTTYARVVDANGTALDAEVVLVGGDGETQEVDGDEQGLYWLGTLPPGPHTLRATWAGRTAETTFTLAAGEERREVELRIP